MELFKYSGIRDWIISQKTTRTAVELADAGIPVFPCKQDKRPMTAHGFKDASTDQTRVALFFRDPAALIAMPTGLASNIAVIDEDPKNGGNLDTLGTLPMIAVARTKSGGRHVFFKHRPGIKNTTGLRPGIDVRGEGGYVVLWAHSSDPSGGPVGEWISGELTSELPDFPELGKGKTLRAGGIDTAAIRNGVKSGNRNDMIFRGLCKYRHLNRSIEDAKEWAADTAANSSPPYTEQDTDEMAERVYAEYEPGNDYVFPEEKAEQERHERVQRAEAAWNDPEVQKIARSYDILDRFRGELRAAGVVGEDRALKLLFVAGHSRFLDRPISVAVEGPSSAGKSYAVESAITKVQPDDAYIFFTGMSERALIHSEESYRHKTLIVAEQSGVDSEYQDYLFRTLLSEGKIKYSVTEKVDGRFVVTEKEKEGPTGLIRSTTKARLHPENETRILSIHMTDTREQTRAVMRAQASNDKREMDAEPWKRYATGLAGQDNRVSVPYSEALADLIEVYDVRQRRDITLLLHAIKTLAIMHQAKRERDHQGRIVASLRDYEMARDLLNDLLSQGIGATVSETIRQTVAAVRALTTNGETTNSNAVAKYLNLGKGSVSDRIKNALSEGYVVNLQEPGKRGHKLALGSGLPEDSLLLPEAHELLDAALCNIVRQFGALRGWTKTAADLPNIVRSIVRPMSRTTVSVPNSGKAYDPRGEENAAYTSHGKPNRGPESSAGSPERPTPPKPTELPNYRTMLQARLRTLQAATVRGTLTELPNHRAELKLSKLPMPCWRWAQT